MAGANSPEGIMMLGRTDRFSFIGVRPPLTEDQLRDLPKLKLEPGKTIFRSIKTFPDGTMGIGFNSAYFEGEGRESFAEFAGRVAANLGYVLNSEVRHMVVPDSVFAQVEGTPDR